MHSGILCAMSSVLNAWRSSPLFVMCRLTSWGVGDLVLRDDERPHGAERGPGLHLEEAGPSAGLEAPGGDVDEPGVAEHLVHRLLLRDVLRVRAHHDGELGLVVEDGGLAVRAEVDGIAVADDAVGRFLECVDLRHRPLTELQVVDRHAVDLLRAGDGRADAHTAQGHAFRDVAELLERVADLFEVGDDELDHLLRAVGVHALQHFRDVHDVSVVLHDAERPVVEKADLHARLFLRLDSGTGARQRRMMGRTTMLSSRRGPVDMRSMGQPITSSIRRT